MIVNSLQYNGACSCGKEHTMQTEFSVIESGALYVLNGYLSKYGLTGYTVAVYDENTYRATSDRHPKVDKEVILDPEDLHANEHGVAYLMENLPKNAELLIAVGSGTVHDLTRYCAYELGIDFVSCPTAASVDGFCSSVAAMTWHGCKKTLTAVAPRIVVADTDVIRRAPIRLAKSGFGDMVGKYIALCDWKIGHILTGEFYCERIADMMLKATEEVLSSVEGIVSGDAEGYEKLTYGLLLSGLAMQMMGNSRPASGAEHHISHLIEMSPPPLDIHSDALHGEKVGVGTLLALREYKRLSQIKSPAAQDYSAFSDETVKSVFGDAMAEEILAENQSNCAAAVSGTRIAEKWREICAEIETLPAPEELSALYSRFAIKGALSDIGVQESLSESLLTYSHLVRNRLTLMRIRRCINDASGKREI